MKKAFILFFVLLISRILYPVEAGLQIEQEKQAILNTWREEKVFFDWRKETAVQKEKAEKGELKPEEELRWADGEILVCIQRGYSWTREAYGEKDFSELEVESVRNLSAKSVVSKQTKETKPYSQIIHIVLKDKSEEAVLSACETLIEREDVYSVHPNLIFTMTTACEEITDPGYDAAVSFDYPYLSDERHVDSFNNVSYETIFAPQVWKKTHGSASVTVAVIDSGVFPHPDLQGNLLAGYDAGSNNSNTQDAYNKHGTHVAGIIAAKANGAHIHGIAPNVKIYPVQLYRGFFADGRCIQPVGTGHDTGACALRNGKCQGKGTADRAAANNQGSNSRHIPAALSLLQKRPLEFE